MTFFLPDNNWCPQHRNSDLSGLFFGTEQNENFYINMFWHVRNNIFREYMSEYWLDSWEIETEEITSRFIIAGDRSINLSGAADPTVRSINVRLGRLVHGKRDYEHFYWCGRTRTIGKYFHKKITDRKGGDERSGVKVMDLMEPQKKFYYSSISSFKRMTRFCMDAGEKIEEMKLDYHSRDLHFELLHYAHIFDAQKINDQHQFRGCLINEYKRQRIRCV